VGASSERVEARPVGFHPWGVLCVGTGFALAVRGGSGRSIAWWARSDAMERTQGQRLVSCACMQCAGREGFGDQ
jgi:hypothetical protein